MRRMFFMLGLLLSSAPTASAELIGVNWALDDTADGLGSGTLGSLGVNLVSTDGRWNGGITYTADWPNQAGTNDVPGIASLSGANRNSFDWNDGTGGFATITFTGGTVTNPILLFDWTDPGATFDFADALTINVLDQSPAGSVTVASGNIVTLNGSPRNLVSDGFALQLLGTFSSFSFNTNLNHLQADSVGFSIAADLSAVPEPTTLVLWSGLGVMGLVMGWRRRKRAG